MMGLVLAPNLLQLFICWELVGVCSYLLIGFYYQKPEAARAAMKAFWITKAGDVGLLIGIVLLWRATGTFDLVELEAMALAGAVPLAGLSVITFCLYLGAAGKSLLCTAWITEPAPRNSSALKSPWVRRWKKPAAANPAPMAVIM
jgi:NADH-quinone oxidoreductase subunit L